MEMGLSYTPQLPTPLWDQIRVPVTASLLSPGTMLHSGFQHCHCYLRPPWLQCFSLTNSLGAWFSILWLAATSSPGVCLGFWKFHTWGHLGTSCSGIFGLFWAVTIATTSPPFSSLRYDIYDMLRTISCFKMTLEKLNVVSSWKHCYISKIGDVEF